MNGVETAADLLSTARRQRRRIDRLPENCRPLSNELGYAIQRRVAADLGAVGGYKIGADSARSTPLYAPIIASGIFASGTVLPAADYSDALIEAEIGFRILRDLRARTERYSYEALAASVEMLPVFEIYSSRYSHPKLTTVPEQLADCLANFGLVYGEPAAAPGRASSSTWTIELNIDGKTRHVSAARHPVEDPLLLVVWLANHLADHGGGLQAGDIVTTGALLLGPVGSQVRGRWQGVGDVTLTFR